MQLSFFDSRPYIREILFTSTLQDFWRAVLNSNCTACQLCKTRIKIVGARGDPKSGIIAVGEAPGASEDRQGIPFVGRAGQLLEDIKSEVFPKLEIYITNILLCRPLNNKFPPLTEVVQCLEFFHHGLELALKLNESAILVPMGARACRALGIKGAMSNLAGHFFKTKLAGRERLVAPTWHPAFILRQPWRLKEAKEQWVEIIKASRSS